MSFTDTSLPLLAVPMAISPIHPRVVLRKYPWLLFMHTSLGSNYKIKNKKTYDNPK
jgi:hypothetical protein